MKVTFNDGLKNASVEERKEALSIAKQGLAIGVGAVVFAFFKWAVICFGLFLLGKYLKLI